MQLLEEIFELSKQIRKTIKKRGNLKLFKTKTFKNTENNINKKTFQNKSSKTNRTIAYIYLIVNLIYVLVPLSELIYINMFVTLKASL